MPSEVWDEITYPFPSFNGCTVEVWDWISNFTLYNGSTLIWVWIINYMPSEVWDEITYPFPSFNGCTVEVWDWISNFIPRFIMDAITYPGFYYFVMSYRNIPDSLETTITLILDWRFRSSAVETLVNNTHSLASKLTPIELLFAKCHRTHSMENAPLFNISFWKRKFFYRICKFSCWWISVLRFDQLSYVTFLILSDGYDIYSTIICNPCSFDLFQMWYYQFMDIRLFS